MIGASARVFHLRARGDGKRLKSSDTSILLWPRRPLPEDIDMIAQKSGERSSDINDSSRL